ncbi:MAG: hypothetical protein ACK5KM_05805 [Hyphomicrobiaceae bacterium]
MKYGACLFFVVAVTATAPAASRAESTSATEQSLSVNSAAPDVGSSEPHTSAEPALSEDCFDELENGTGAELACIFPLRLSPDEQMELEKGSRGYIKNVTCTLKIRIARHFLEAPLGQKDHVFESPEQPVACQVTTHKSTIDITATFAPRIEFKDDKAVKATPGLANVKGVNRFISWPVVQFVNRWPSIRSGMLQVANALLERQRKKQEAGEK